MAPTQTADNGRTTSGRFAKGNSGGPGRPRGIDFRAVVAQRAEAEGSRIEEIIWEVFEMLLAASRAGDVQAARVLLDRLCGKETSRIDVGVDAGRTMSDLERATRISAILHAAQARARTATGGG